MKRWARLAGALLAFLLPAAAMGQTINESMPMHESLSYQVFHNGVPVGGPTVVTPDPALTDPPAAVPPFTIAAVEPPLAAVPEPSTWVLVVTAGAGLAAWGWRRR